MLDFFLSYFLLYKYIVLLFVVFFASFGIPLPATALLMAAGAFAAQGYIEIEMIFIFGIISSVLGDCLGYFISWRYGKNFLMRAGFRTIFQSKKFETIENTFRKHSVFLIFTSRFIFTSLGPSVNMLAGFSKIQFRRFFFYDFLGEFLYIFLISGLGYIFGNQWEIISSISQYIVSIFVLVILLAIGWKVLEKKGKKGRI